MNVIKIIWSNLWAKPLSSLLSLLLLTLGTGLISLLLLLNHQLEEKFTRNIKGIDMVIGAKGSPLQLILSALYHIDNPTGNISLEEVSRFTKNPLIKKTIPLSYGDNFQGYRIVGTNQAFLKHYELTLSEGGEWKNDFEVTLGAAVARKTQLKVGDTFYSSHGLLDERNQHEDQVFKVVGIFESNNSVADQLILCSTESVWGIHNHGTETDHHDHHDHEEGHDHAHHHETESAKEITALLVEFISPMGNVQIPRLVNEQTSMQAALPAIEVNRLFTQLGIGFSILRAIALVIMLTSGISVFISLFNSLKERKYELAIMRTLGASRFKLFFIIVGEGLCLAILGFVLGLVFSRLGLLLLSSFSEQSFHYSFDGFYFLPSEGVLFVATIFIGLLAAGIPALQVFRLNISKTLASV